MADSPVVPHAMILATQGKRSISFRIDRDLDAELEAKKALQGIGVTDRHERRAIVEGARFLLDNPVAVSCSIGAGWKVERLGEASGEPVRRAGCGCGIVGGITPHSAECQDRGGL